MSPGLPSPPVDSSLDNPTSCSPNIRTRTRPVTTLGTTRTSRNCLRNATTHTQTDRTLRPISPTYTKTLTTPSHTYVHTPLPLSLSLSLSLSSLYFSGNLHTPNPVKNDSSMSFHMRELSLFRTGNRIPCHYRRYFPLQEPSPFEQGEKVPYVGGTLIWDSSSLSLGTQTREGLTA